MRICVEGNIGSGKSTALRALAGLVDAENVVQEPLGAWGTLLDKYYADPAEWGLTFNLRVLHSFCRVARGTGAKPVVVERSPMACRHVFGQLLYNDGILPPAAWELFKDYCDELGWVPDAFVYVDTPVDMCMRRVKARGRSCEQGLSEEYLKRIEFAYENMFRFVDVPMVRVDGSKTPAEVVADIAAAISTLTN
jgi:deoxyadenosine/deoxycytidine kinase